MNKDVTYCKGKNCLLRSSCKRYVDGQAIPIGEMDQHWWMEHCDVETRECYWKV